MKKVLLFIMVALIFSVTNSFGQTKIGEMKDGKYVITYDAGFIKDEAEKKLKEQGYSEKITRLEIQKDKIEKTGKVYYILLAQNENQSIKIASQLELMDSDFIQASPSIFYDSVTCNGCTRGCSPRRHADDGIIEWYCSNCSVGKGCKKSETRSSISGKE